VLAAFQSSPVIRYGCSADFLLDGPRGAVNAHLVWVFVVIVVLADAGCAGRPRGSLTDLELSELTAIPDSELQSLAAALCGRVTYS
jgi:hypothetical protein